MSNNLHDVRTAKIYRLMMQKFSQSDLNELYFDLQVDSDGVPKPANKQAYIEYLMRYMFSRNQQRVLTARLKSIRPKETWEDTYSLRIGVDKHKATKFLDKSRPQKRRVSKDEKLQQVEQDIYEKMFKHTPVMAWLILLFSLSGGMLFLWLYFTEAQVWIDYGYLLFFVIVIAILTPLPIIFRVIHWFLRGSTQYYDLSVNDRAKVRTLLQKRTWGNTVTNLICFVFIQFMVGINLHQINRRLKG